jgi:putative phosphoribosyl transferase
VVVAIPRGGVPVAAEIATALGAPLDVIVVRKIGAPGNPEFGIGALAEDAVGVVDGHTLRALGVEQSQLDALIARAAYELTERERHYRQDRPPHPVQDHTVLLVDDGLATGHTARAAALTLRKRGAASVVLAVPVASAQSAHALKDAVDEVICLQMPRDLSAIGLWYEDFRPPTDEELAPLLPSRP